MILARHHHALLHARLGRITASISPSSMRIAPHLDLEVQRALGTPTVPSCRHRPRSPVRYRRAPGPRRERIRHEALRGQLRPVQIPQRHPVPADVHLPGHPTGTRLPVLVENVALRVGDRPPDRTVAASLSGRGISSSASTSSTSPSARRSCHSLACGTRSCSASRQVSIERFASRAPRSAGCRARTAARAAGSRASTASAASPSPPAPGMTRARYARVAVLARAREHDRGRRPGSGRSSSSRERRS